CSDPDYDLAAKRVAVIGTGASAVQVVPEIASLVSQLRVFQRTPIWIGPRMDRPLRHGRLALRWFGLIRRLLRLASESGLEFLTFSIVNYRRLPFVVSVVQRSIRAR